MASEPNVVSLCERGDSDPHAPFGAPDPKSSTPPTETPKQRRRTRTKPHASAPNRTEHVTAGVTWPVLVRGAEFIDQRLIYGLVDPREPERVRYVGQTTRTPIFRYAGHISLPKGYEPSLRCAWVAELREAGVYPDMVLLEKVAKSVDLDDRELHWIAALKAIGQADTNAPLPRWYVDGKPRPPMPWQDERRAARRAAR